MSSHRLYDDPWLGEMLGCDAFRLSFESPGKLHPAGFSPPAGNGTAGIVFIHAKTEVHALAETGFLEANGFRLIDTNLTFERPRSSDVGPGNPQVRRARPEDEDAVVRLAGSGFTLDRFHLDPQVPKDAADRLKGEWVRNFFKGKRGTAMVVAETGGRVAGFLLFLLVGDALIIDLVAVSPDQMGKGLAAAMTRYGENLFPSAPILRVGTQIGNGRAIRAYQKLGFRLMGAGYVFHYHGPMPAFAAAPASPGSVQ